MCQKTGSRGKQLIPNFAETARDKFLWEMMDKYGFAGSYVTDIVRDAEGDGCCAMSGFVPRTVF